VKAQLLRPKPETDPEEVTMPKTELPAVPPYRPRRHRRRPPLPQTFSSPFWLADGTSFRHGHALEKLKVRNGVFAAMTYKGAARKRRLDELMATIEGLPTSRRKRLGAIARKEIATFREEDRRDPDWAWGLRNDALWPPNLGGTASSW
jgi:hypothetical protein